MDPTTLDAITRLITAVGVILAAYFAYRATVDGKKNATKIDAVTAQTGVIHTLVNSNLTEAIEGNLAATIQGTATLRTLAARDAADKLPVNPVTAAAIVTGDAKVAELQAKLTDRKAQQDVVAGQQRADQAAGITVPLPGPIVPTPVIPPKKG